MINDPRAEKTIQEAEKICQLLEREKVPCVVIGAIAMAVHGFARQTVDLDLGTCVDPFGALNIIAKKLREAGYEVDYFTPDSEDSLGGVVNIQGTDFDPIQIVNFLNPFRSGASALMLDTLTTADRPGNSPFLVADIAHLIALKVYAGGPGSRADVLALMAANPDLDIDSVKNLCERFGLKEGWESMMDEGGRSR